jgi:hypothetical protein
MEIPTNRLIWGLSFSLSSFWLVGHDISRGLFIWKKHFRVLLL